MSWAKHTQASVKELDPEPEKVDAELSWSKWLLAQKKLAPKWKASKSRIGPEKVAV